MSCFEYLKELLANEKIDLVSSIPLSECRVMRKYKLERAGLDTESDLHVYMLAVPYKFRDIQERNISEYAICRDYHLYFDKLFEKITKNLEEKYIGCKFCGFADSSPIDEVHAAARSGLGVIGKNNLLITKKHSSYVFLGEIITNYPESEFTITDISECKGCGQCLLNCPKSQYGICLSSLTQKKGILTKDEEDIIKAHKLAWGCDICQEVCPHTKEAIESGEIYTKTPYFMQSHTPILTREIIEGMSDEEFSHRAYSWRKRETILRNLDIIQN